MRYSLVTDNPVFISPDYNGFGYAIISSWILGEIILRTKHKKRYKIAKEVNLS
jgi:hypothetical protein